MLRFRLKNGCGLHVERGLRGRKTYKPGDVIETNNELDVMFKNTGKFIRLSDSPAVAAGGTEVAALSPSREHEAGQSIADQYGMDVTAVNWAGLLDGPYRVYQKGRWYNIIEVATGTRLNEKNLTQEQVTARVVEMLPDAEQ